MNDANPESEKPSLDEPVGAQQPPEATATVEAAAEPTPGGFLGKLDRALNLAWQGLGSRYVTWILMLLVAAAYFSLVTGKLRENSDSVVYLRLAENLAAGKGYTYQGKPHAVFVPGWPLMLAGVMKIGTGEIWQINLFLALLGVGMCVAAWLLARLLTSQGTANLVLLVFAFSEDTMKWSQRPLSEVAFTLVMLLALACIALAWRNKHLSLPWGLAGGGLSLLAVFMRPTGAILFPVLFVWLWMEVPRAGNFRALLPRGRQAWTRCALAAAFCVAGASFPTCWAIRAHRQQKTYQPSYVRAGKTAKAATRITGVAAPKAWRTTVALAENFVGHYTARSLGERPTLVIRTGLMLLSVLGLFVLGLRRRALIPAFVLANFALIVLFARTLPRYVFPSLPLAVIAAVCGAAILVRKTRLPGKIAAVFLLVGICLLGGKAYQSNRRKAHRPQGATEYRRLAAWIRTRPGRADFRACAYHSRRVAYFCKLPTRRFPTDNVAAFPAFFCHYGGFELLVLDLEGSKADRAALAGAEKMAGWGMFKLVRVRELDAPPLTVYRIVHSRTNASGGVAHMTDGQGSLSSRNSAEQRGSRAAGGIRASAPLCELRNTTGLTYSALARSYIFASTSSNRSFQSKE